MVNFNDEASLLAQYESYIKLQHVLLGIYLWEYVVNLPFDYKVMTTKKRSGQGRIPWVKMIYLSCRFWGLAAIITIVAGLDITGPINCQAWVTLSFTFSYIALSLASCLIAIRVLAIWSWNKYVVALAIAGLGTQAGTLIHNIVQLRAVYSPGAGTCITTNPYSGTPNVTATFVLDMMLLITMLVGLWRMREAGRFRLWRVLLNQGLFWIFLATVAEVPTVIFIYFNFNAVLDTIFYSPELIILIIGATRLYRSLTEFTQRTPTVAGATTGAQSSGLRFNANNNNNNSNNNTSNSSACTRTHPPIHVMVNHNATTNSVSAPASDTDADAHSHRDKEDEFEMDASSRSPEPRTEWATGDKEGLCPV